MPLSSGVSMLAATQTNVRDIKVNGCEPVLPPSAIVGRFTPGGVFEAV